MVVTLECSLLRTAVRFGVSRGSDFLSLYARKKNHRNHLLRPFLTQSDSASRKRSFSTGLFFDWNLLVLLIVIRVDFIPFVLFLLIEAVGVREYHTAVWQSKIGWQLCDSRVLREQRVLELDESSSSELMALGLAESRQSYVTLSREPPKLQQA